MKISELPTDLRELAEYESKTQGWVDNKLDVSEMELDVAFVWSYSPQGHDYWMKINKEYEVLNHHKEEMQGDVAEEKELIRAAKNVEP